MRIILLGVKDISSQVIGLSRESSSYNAGGILTRRRTITISNADGALSPFIDGGYLKINYFRSQRVDIYDDDNDLVFAGLIDTVAESDTYNGRVLIITANDVIGHLLEYYVDENNKITNFQVSGIHGKGVTMLNLKTGTVQLPVICVMHTSSTLVPSYSVKNTNGNPTISIEIDRGIETELAANASVLFSTPVEKTFSGAIYDALTLALSVVGITPGDRLNVDEFTKFYNEDTAANHKVWMFIRKEDGISLSTHIKQLLEMGDLLLTLDENERVKPIRGLAWDGSNPIYNITGDEILAPVERIWDTSRLIYAYNCLYKSGDTVELATGQINDPRQLDEWKLVKAWTPVSHKSKNVIDYQYLYNNSTTATYFGDQKLAYYGKGRTQLKCGLKPYYSGTKKPIEPYQFRDYLLSISVGQFQYYNSEPVKLIAHESDEFLHSVTFELSNNPTPGLPV